MSVKYKITVIGDSGVGKTSLLSKYTNEKFNITDPILATIGLDSFRRNLVISKNNVQLNLIDTAGQERYRALTSSYLRNSNAVLVMYSIDDRTSFDNTIRWLNDARNFVNVETLFFLVASKIDTLDNLRIVTTNEGSDKSISDEYAGFFQVSSCNGFEVYINDMFTNIVDSISKY